jgi:hypothetical protein
MAKSAFRKELQAGCARCIAKHARQSRHLSGFRLRIVRGTLEILRKVDLAGVKAEAAKMGRLIGLGTIRE